MNSWRCLSLSLLQTPRQRNQTRGREVATPRFTDVLFRPTGLGRCQFENPKRSIISTPFGARPRLSALVGADPSRQRPRLFWALSYSPDKSVAAGRGDGRPRRHFSLRRGTRVPATRPFGASAKPTDPRNKAAERGEARAGPPAAPRAPQPAPPHPPVPAPGPGPAGQQPRPGPPARRRPRQLLYLLNLAAAGY